MKQCPIPQNAAAVAPSSETRTVVQARVKAFGSTTAADHEFDVSSTGEVRIWIARSKRFSDRHGLSPATVRKIQRMAGQ